jgi:DNA-binding GntR family transcriptional regulator
MKAAENQLAGQVCARIRSMILAGELRPGQRLVEAELADQLGVGRTPVREALLMLQGEGFAARRHGWEVLGVDYTIHTLFESRAAIEAESARLAAGKISRPALARMAELVEMMEDGPRMPRPRLNDLNAEYHGIIVAAADNSLLAKFRERAMFLYWALRVPVVLPDALLPTINQQHRDLMEALGRGRADEAMERARSHVEHTMVQVELAFAQTVHYYENLAGIASLESGPSNGRPGGITR